MIAPRFATGVKDLVMEMRRNKARRRGRSAAGSRGWVRRRSRGGETGVFEGVGLRSRVG